jgi:N-glycosylase/DNA lyase
MREFRSNKEHMSELCFCLLTANYTAEGGIRIQKEMGDFSGLSASQIEKELRRLGYRFPKVRAGYISIAQDYRNDLCRLSCMESSMERRKWLVENIKGLGYKEASHFLRNIGYDDVAIIDRHIIRVLEEHQLIPSTKSISPKKYLEIEEILSVLAHKSGTSLGELDLYLWYLKTGKILK